MDFIWGSSLNARKCHLIVWDTLCLPKFLGGLGFKNTSHVNDAFIMKIGWNVLTKPNELLGLCSQREVWT